MFFFIEILKNCNPNPLIAVTLNRHIDIAISPDIVTYLLSENSNYLFMNFAHNFQCDLSTISYIQFTHKLHDDPDADAVKRTYAFEETTTTPLHDSTTATTNNTQDKHNLTGGPGRRTVLLWKPVEKW